MSELTADERLVLDRIDQKPDLALHFFNKVKGFKWLQPLVAKGYLDPDKIQGPVAVDGGKYIQFHSWPALQYLQRLSEDFGGENGVDIANKVWKIVCDITEYAIINKIENYRVWYQFSEIFKKLPHGVFGVEDIAVVAYWLSDQYDRGLSASNVADWLVRYLDSDASDFEIVKGIVNALYCFRVVDKGRGRFNSSEVVLNFVHHNVLEITKNISDRIGRIYRNEGSEVFKVILEGVLDAGENDSYSTVWRPAIEDESEQNRDLNDANDILLNAFRDSVGAFVHADPEHASIYLQGLAGSKYQVIRRISVYLLNIYFEEISNASSILPLSEYLDDISLRHELWHLLENRYGLFNPEVKDLLISKILSISENDDDGQLSDKRSAYKKSEWLMAIKDFDKTIKVLFEECIGIAGCAPDHPDYPFYMTSGWRGSNESPIPFEKLFAMEPDELVNTLNSFEMKGDIWDSGAHELSSCFSKVVRQKITNNSLDFDSFKRLKINFLCDFIGAFESSWNERDQACQWGNVWPRLIGFIVEVFSDLKSWDEASDQFISRVCRLIGSGCADDTYSFDLVNISQAKHLLDIVLARQPSRVFEAGGDAVMFAINSPRGNAFEAYIKLSLFEVRNAVPDDRNEIWEKYKGFYDAEISKFDQDNRFEFPAILGMYLHNVCYLSELWVFDNIEKIFDRKNPIRWQCAIHGYAYVNSFNPAIYKFLRDSDQIIDILDSESLKKELDRKYLQFVVLAYLRDMEDLSDNGSVISRIIARNDIEELGQIIWFVWTLRKDGDKKLTDKALALFSRLVELVNLDDEQGKLLASKLCSLAIYIEELDEEKEQWLIKIARYSGINHNSDDLLAALVKLSVKHPLATSRVWEAMLIEYTYDYAVEKIQETLANINAHEPDGYIAAKRVVSAYAKHGMLRPGQILANIRGQDV